MTPVGQIAGIPQLCHLGLWPFHLLQIQMQIQVKTQIVIQIQIQDMQGYHGYVTFTWVYGLFTGGYQYRSQKNINLSLIIVVWRCTSSIYVYKLFHSFNKFETFHSFSLKMYVYQKVRARNFARAWGYIQVWAELVWVKLGANIQVWTESVQ